MLVEVNEVPHPIALAAAAWLCASTAAAAPSPARRCSCVLGTPPRTAAEMRDKLAAVDAAFAGRVVRLAERVDTVPVGDGRRPWLISRWVATVRVSRRWKGVEGDSVTVETNMQVTTCGTSLAEGATYLFFAGAGADRRLSVSSCDSPRQGRRARRDRGLLDQAVRAGAAGRPASGA